MKGLHTDTGQLLQKLRKRDAAVWELQKPYLANWTDIRDFLGPRTARLNNEKQNDALRQDLNIINTSPRYAVRALPAGMQSGVTSPMRPWFRLGTPDPELEDFEPVKLWLSEVERRMRMVMSRCNLYDRLKSNYGILGLYGTSNLFIDEDDDDIFRCYDYAMGSWAFSTNAVGRVNAMHRKVEMSVIQWYERFGEDNIPALVKNAYDKGNYENRFPVTHIVEPNRLHRPGSPLTQFKPWASIYLNGMNPTEGEDSILQYKGYDSQPFFGPRWDIVGEDIYGVGCGEYAIGDSKQLQLQEKRALQVLDKFADPTMVADGSMRNSRTSSLPGDTVYVNGLINGRQGFVPAYQIGNPHLDAIEAKQRQVEERINEAFYKNLFLMVAEMGDQPNITATQINTMREEKLMMLGPVLERLNDELLDPMIDRVFNSMYARGMFPEPPPEIQNMPLRVEYISVLAQAQKAMGIGNIERFAGFVGNMAQFDPTAMSKFNVYEAINEYADGTGVPPKLLRTDDDATAMVQKQQEQAQGQQMLENAPGLADSMKKLAETEIQGEPALDRVLNATTNPTG